VTRFTPGLKAGILSLNQDSRDTFDHRGRRIGNHIIAEKN
jgi:hypothetical protein